MKSGAEPSREVDLRVLQANERTLLAWIRTGLALMAFGFVVARVGVWLEEGGSAPLPDAAQGYGKSLAAGVGAALLLLGTVCNGAAAVRYLRIRDALLRGRPVTPSPIGVVLLAFSLGALGAMLAAQVLFF